MNLLKQLEDLKTARLLVEQHIIDVEKTMERMQLTWEGGVQPQLLTTMNHAHSALYMARTRIELMIKDIESGGIR